MASNRGRTRPELRFAKALWARGHRYFTAEGWRKLTGQKLRGKPDLVFPSARLLLFVDGCFWHGCPLHYSKPIGANRTFWEQKLHANMRRDAEVTLELTSRGWLVLRLWEHDVKPACLDSAAERVATLLHTRSRLDRPIGLAGRNCSQHTTDPTDTLKEGY
jgi:DNA mismatch endonuclease, patch repair protein